MTDSVAFWFDSKACDTFMTSRFNDLPSFTGNTLDELLRVLQAILHVIVSSVDLMMSLVILDFSGIHKVFP